AISRIGLAAFGGIVIGMSVREKMFRMRGFEPRLRALWRHSATTAVWAMEISRLQAQPVEGAFLAGLLHDMGKAVVLQAVGDLSRSKVEDIDPDLCEQLMVEFHAEVGADLLSTWSLPEELVEAVRNHHRAEDAGGEYGTLASVIVLANSFAHWTLEISPEDRASTMTAPLGAAARFADVGVDPAQLPALLSRVDRVIDLAGSF
ncbi:MAG: HDOD domain-containing protein, partial [Planctomycetota bacterium]